MMANSTLDDCNGNGVTENLMKLPEEGTSEEFINGKCGEKLAISGDHVAMEIQENVAEPNGPSTDLSTGISTNDESSVSPIEADVVDQENTQTTDIPSDIESDEGVTPTKKRKADEDIDEEEEARRQRKVAGIKLHQKLKKSGEGFVQTSDCDKLKTPLGNCLECKLRGYQPTKKNNFCRFRYFRLLRYCDKHLIVKGFPDANDSETYKEEDIQIWTPGAPPKGITFDDAKFLLSEVGDLFCQLVAQEKETLLHLKEQDAGNMIWRKPVDDLRELCDVCSTTLFNYHWTCAKCGFVVCVSCFNARKASKPAVEEQIVTVEQISTTEEAPSVAPVIVSRKDSFGWLRCSKKQEHDFKSLVLTQIIAEKALDTLWTQVHDLRISLEIPSNCKCDFRNSTYVKSLSQCNGGGSKFAARLLETEAPGADESDEEEDDQGGILGLFVEQNETPAEAEGNNLEPNVEEVVPTERPDEACITITSEPTDAFLLKNFVRKKGTTTYTLNVVPKIPNMNSQTTKKYPNVKHDWSCSGYLLRLLEPSNPGNLKMFQEQWKRGQPVIVSNVGNQLDRDLWLPDAFSRDFGHETNNFINCMTGKVVPNRKMKVFWDGFEHEKKRLTDDEGTRMLLKLKDWPPGADFAKTSKVRFDDLMQALPLGEYTHREGKFNLAARLPEVFCKPDLGPKMYIAYGSGLHLDKGTTNLHLDVSDAVNVMVYVGELKDDDPENNKRHKECVKQAIEESDCDQITIGRVLGENKKPGALWHIYEAKDADKIRDLINKIKIEANIRVDKHHDPIHDQSCYLDNAMRERLRTEYNVVGYPIIQCEGDAVFIPAGAPHQVRNLNNCIKIAEDFVSPENVGHCFYLTEEFRNLTETHTNHEDKLQVKNIVFHAVKDAVAVLKDKLAI